MKVARIRPKRMPPKPESGAAFIVHQPHLRIPSPPQSQIVIS